jgi:hypothetical protein
MRDLLHAEGACGSKSTRPSVMVAAAGIFGGPLGRGDTSRESAGRAASVSVQSRPPTASKPSRGQIFNHLQG